MARKRKLIHFGQEIKDVVITEDPAFDYVHLSGQLADQLIDGWPLLLDGQLNSQFRNDLFLITAPVTSEEYAELLPFLPANQTMRTADILPLPETTSLETLKNIQLVTLTDITVFRKLIVENFLPFQVGYKFGVDTLSFASAFKGDIEQNGHNFVRITDNVETFDAYTYIASWTGSFSLPRHSIWELTGEFKALNQSTNVMVRIQLYGVNDPEPYFQQDVENMNLLEPQFLSLDDNWAYVTFSLFVKGHAIDFKMGALHLRQSHEGRGVLMVGGHRLVDRENMGEELTYYFDPADLKPPLSVYFSGFRPAEGYEANFMMRRLGTPFLIFGDPRLEGGAFYTGNEYLQKQVVKVINETLKQLGFTKDQLILSGLSMGTYGALKYASHIVPHAVVLGKPLTNLGDIASSGRIERPEEFATAEDIMTKVSDGLTEPAIEQANASFWDDFKGANFSHTTFVLSYMENDDYDGRAFEDLRSYLTETYPGIRILHHGLVGRHNDDTPGVVDWFLRQFRNILSSDFNR